MLLLKILYLSVMKWLPERINLKYVERVRSKIVVHRRDLGISTTGSVTALRLLFLPVPIFMIRSFSTYPTAYRVSVLNTKTQY